MTLIKWLLFCLALLCQCVCAQRIPVELSEVIVSDVQLKNFTNTQSVATLNDSIIQKNSASLATVLNYNSVVYFKENGLGMVASPSFRGTSAAQTAVIWNGININSQLLGQTDFNTITTRSYNSIAVRAGGGSAIYGSGAIGGSIHLNNEIDFKEHILSTLQANFGSFNTLGWNYDLKLSNKKMVAQINVARMASDNDYDYLNSDLKNENGQFYNTTYSANFGFKINKNNVIKSYHQIFDGQRHFSLASPSDTKTKYKDFNTRSLTEWSSIFNRFESKVKLAYTTENFQYFEDIKYDNYDYGKVKSIILKYDLTYQLFDKLKFNTVLDFTQNDGSGSGFVSKKRQIASFNFVLSHHVSEHWQYEFGIRKETTNNYESPFLFVVGSNIKIAKFYRLKINFSRNFRIPTFNDLYWEGVGNPDLKPESAFQGEIGNIFTLGNCSFTTTFYHINIRDMIRWIPGNGGLFSPQNTNKVAVFGFETLFHWHKKIKRNRLEWNATYAYTNSKNTEMNRQLIYVPYHKLTNSIGYAFRQFDLHCQHLFNGKVFTQTDNNPDKIVKDYSVVNLIFDYNFDKNETYKLGFSVLNVLNKKYESVANRPMPGVNFNINLTLKF